MHRIAEGSGRISHVFPLNGRLGVIRAALNDDGLEPRRVYIIDRDLDALTGTQVPPCKRLHQIAAYSVENLLLTESALLEIAAECAHDSDERTLAERLSYSKNAPAVVRCLLPLFEYYAVVTRLNLSIPTVSYAILRLVIEDDRTLTLSVRAIRIRITELRREIVNAVGWSRFRHELQVVRAASRRLPNPAHAISGKDYLLTLAHTYLRKVVHLRDSFNGFRVRLAGRFNPDSAPQYRDFILSMLRETFHLQDQRQSQ